ncbi:MAG: hypothetical protein JZU58_12485 [Curvibacter lanceolatus]|jgi:hypothetical protein|uniref:hypothetical protein n=1 Tax=Curvibacter lanceolatus TaxID=86182 RepID=UPI0012FBB356|nr:hypothetical protein [Curvibacter lanceolatus]MBV5293154.1 hypothetical protein [Curvibacter lanceolatus]
MNDPHGAMSVRNTATDPSRVLGKLFGLGEKQKLGKAGFWPLSSGLLPNIGVC